MLSFKKLLAIFSCIIMFCSVIQGKKVKTKNLVKKSLFKSLSYRAIGPTRQSGRFIDFAVSNRDPFTFYAATGSGGLWKTTNNGTTFKPIFDFENVFSIGDIAIAPSDNRILYVGTGEANNSRSTYWGDGVYKTVNGGKTWKNTGLKESHHIGRIVVHPLNPDIVYVAALGHLYSANPQRGVYKSINGGKKWKKVLEVKVGRRFVGVADLVMDPKNPDILYACSYDRHRRPWTYDIGGIGSGIYKSTDAGKNWKKLTQGLPGGLLGRIGIDVYDKDPNILYTCIENVNKPKMTAAKRWEEIQQGISSRGMIDGEIYRSDDAGNSWKKVSPDKKSIGGGPAYYYGQIIIDPDNDKIVHVLSAASWGTYDGGKTWKRRPFKFGGDDHALWIDPRDSRHMLLGYDHGMGITYDSGKTWIHPDTFPLAQFYAIGVDMSYPYNVAGGLQDNGSVLGPSTKPNGKPILLEDWKRVGGGDGMYNVFDWKNNRYIYNESQFGPITRTDLKTGERKYIRYKKRGLRWNWNSPILVSPHDSNVIYHGANILLKSPYRGEYWKEISKDLTTNDKTKLPNRSGGDGNIQYCTITTLDESVLIRGQLWVGTDDGNVWVSESDGKKWTKLNDNIKGNPGYWVSRVFASHHHPRTAYVSYTGYRRDDFKAYIYKTTNLGKTWKKITNGLPQAPVNVIKEDPVNPELLYAGTELGTYISLDGGESWINFELNMPRQPVHDLVIHPRENDLVLGTHGRGIFITDITPLQELNQKVLAEPVHLFNIEAKVDWMDNNMNVSSYTNYQGESEPRGLIIYYYLKKKVKKDFNIEVYQRARLISKLKGKKTAGLHKVLWNMTKREKRSEKEKKMVQARIKMMRRYGFNRKIDIDYKYTPVSAGEYKFVLIMGKTRLVKFGRILQDHWTK